MQRISIKNKIILTVVPIVAAGTLAISLFLLNRFSSSYKEALEQRSFAIGNTISNAVYNNLNYFSLDSFSQMSEYLQNILKVNEGVVYAFIADGEGKVLYHSESEKNGTKLPEDIYPEKIEKRINLCVGNFYESVIPIVWESTTIGSIHLGIPTEAVDGKIRQMVFGGVVIFSVSLLVIFLAIHFISRAVFHPLKMTVKMFQQFSQGEGDLTRKLIAKSKDEIGDMASYFNLFVEKLQKMVQELKKGNEEVAFSSNELASNAQENAASIQQITASIKSVASNVQQEKEKIAESTHNIKEIIKNINRINDMTEEIKNQIRQSSSSIEKMAANIANLSEIANQGNQISENLENVSEDGKKAIESLSVSIETVFSNSSEIQEMVQLIMDISEQTNLLAMNAAIEAAHAGEYGKGFAVVSEEIRKLADKSSRSAREIQEVVRKIVESIQQNQRLSNKTKESFNLLKKEIDKVRQSNFEIASSMKEQKEANRSILDSLSRLNDLSVRISEDLNSQVDRGQKIDKMLAELQMLSEEIATAMEEEKAAIQETSLSVEYISKISNQLKEISDKVKLDFHKFKTE